MEGAALFLFTLNPVSDPFPKNPPGGAADGKAKECQVRKLEAGIAMDKIFHGKGDGAEKSKRQSRPPYHDFPQAPLML
jgi:hypothetical protein